ncbi:hypothetical protein VTK73DRAFT_10292 [Phialemonium thermophilum]|uniref:Uncharacterized protein n=1 Tax=Phialemonium thermophilum TaxID=223376 RepID=A0ABR3VXS4_9PEZI
MPRHARPTYGPGTGGLGSGGADRYIDHGKTMHEHLPRSMAAYIQDLPPKLHESKRTPGVGGAGEDTFATGVSL